MGRHPSCGWQPKPLACATCCKTPRLPGPLSGAGPTDPTRRTPSVPHRGVVRRPLEAGTVCLGVYPADIAWEQCRAPQQHLLAKQCTSRTAAQERRGSERRCCKDRPVRPLWCPAVGALSRGAGAAPWRCRQYQGYRVGRAALSRGPRRRCRPGGRADDAASARAGQRGTGGGSLRTANAKPAGANANGSDAWSGRVLRPSERSAHDAVAPENRLVARTLEQHWEAKLRAAATVEQDDATWQRQRHRALSGGDRQAILA